MVRFAVRIKVLQELFSDPKWDEKMKKARNLKEVEKVIKGFCKEKGYEVRVR